MVKCHKVHDGAMTFCNSKMKSWVFWSDKLFEINFLWPLTRSDTFYQRF